MSGSRRGSGWGPARIARGRKAIALISTLVVSTVLLVLGVAFLAYLERDYRFAATQARNQEALYLALSGLEYANARPDLIGTSPCRCSVPSANPNRYFEIVRRADNTLQSTGVVRSGLISVTKTLTVPAGQSPRHFLESGL